MVDAGRERLDVCSRPVLPGVGGGGVDGGAVVALPSGGGGIFVCVVGIFAGVSCTVIFGGFEIKEALSVLAFSAASRSAFCCRRILSTNW